MKSGSFITFEGIEGLGKSTHVQTVADYLTRQGIDFIRTREPGGTPVAEQIRQILLTAEEPLAGETELLLLYAGRLQHVQQVIQPALEKGQWVLCDRFADASFAYQGAGRGIPIARIAALHAWVLGDFQPDVTLWFDAPVAVGLQRIQARSKDRFHRIDAAPDLATVTTSVLAWCRQWHAQH